MTHTLWVLVIIILGGPTVEIEIVTPFVKPEKCFKELYRGAEESGVRMGPEDTGFWVEKGRTWAECIPVEHGMIW